MKHLLFFLLAFPFLASAQILEKQFVATVQYNGFTQINDSLYRGDLIEFRDVLIEGYQPSGVDSGFICLDGTGRAYRVEVVNSFDYSSLNVDLIELDDYDEIPIGVGIFAERYGSTYQIPNGLVNSIGISAVLQAKILNHNTKIAATTVQPPDTLYLQELSGTTAISNGDTIPLINYVRVVDTSAMLFKYIERGDTAAMLARYIERGDTASMLTNYPSTAGYGIIDGGKTWRVDTTSPNGLTTRLFAKTLPTSIASNYIATSNGTNLIARNLFDNNTYAGVIARPWKFGEYTTAGLPSGVTGYHVYNTTTNGPGWYQGSRWAYGLESTFNRGTATRIPFFDANGQVTDNSLLTYTSATGVLKTTNYTFNEAPGIILDPFGTSQLALIMPTNGNFTIFSDGGSIIPFYANQKLGNINNVWDIAYINRYVSTFAGSPSAPMLTYRVAGNNIPAGMYFIGNFANHDVGFSTNAQTRFYMTYAGLVGINTTSPTQDFDINGDLYARDSSRLATTPSHSSITGLLTRDANGWVGRARLGTDFTYAGDSIKLASSPTWLKPQLESIGNVKITSTNSLTFKTGITRWTGSSEQTGTYISPGFVGLYKTSAGNMGGAVGFTDTIARDNAFYFQQDDRGIIQNTGTGRQLNLFADNTSLPGQYRWAFGARVDTSSSPLTTLRVMLGDRHASTIAPVMVSVNAGIQPSESIANAGVNIVVAGDNGKKAFSVNNLINARVGGKVYFAEDSTFSFNPSTDILQLSQYGTGAKEAADLSKTQSNFNATFATDGTIIEREQKRDTTIYVIDTDYDFSAAVTTTQVGNRYNRVIFLMTTTAAAGSDSELTLHTPDANLMQVEYLVRSTDEAGGFANKIVFGTNNAVDSTNGLVTNYFPAAGQGVGIRAGLRSAAYKYFYY